MANKRYNYKPVVLVVLDGLGIDVSATNSPWQKAQRPVFSEIERFWPFTTLQASGAAVGLPWGKEGNSEVGHLTMGSGRIVYNHLPRIISAISDGSFFQNEALLKAVEQTEKNNAALHLMGLFSSGSVHAYTEHVLALLELAKKSGVPKIYLHLFTDGRDSPVREGADFVKEFIQEMEKNFPMAKIASIIGRNYSMDRDGNWNRTEKTYRLLTEGAGNVAENPITYLKEQYENGFEDSSVEPVIFSKDGLIRNGDAVIFWNFREDSARQLTQSFVDKNFNKFPREHLPDLVFVTMTEYDKKLPVPAAFPPLDVKWPLAAVLSQTGLKQLHLAETEKYAHVTYFFNGGVEKPFDNEERILIPSPAGKKYDEIPEMSTRLVTKTILENLFNYDFILANFANTDMVGHTGNFDACVKAIEAVDYSMGEIITAILQTGGVLAITADHGNIEEKFYKLTGEKKTEHSTNPVPFYLIAGNLKRKEPRSDEEIKNLYKSVSGTLADVAPAVLELFNISKPEEMTGKSLLEKLK